MRQSRPSTPIGSSSGKISTNVCIARVHPSLSQLVPIYGRGLIMEGDDPNWRQTADDPDPKYKGGLRGGASTWSLDGQLTGVPFSRLSDEDRRRGAVYVIKHAVGLHRRASRLRPRGQGAAARPELTELDAEYLFSAESSRARDSIFTKS